VELFELLACSVVCSRCNGLHGKEKKKEKEKKNILVRITCIIHNSVKAPYFPYCGPHGIAGRFLSTAPPRRRKVTTCIHTSGGGRLDGMYRRVHEDRENNYMEMLCICTTSKGFHGGDIFLFLESRPFRDPCFSEGIIPGRGGAREPLPPYQSKKTPATQKNGSMYPPTNLRALVHWIEGGKFWFT